MISHALTIVRNELDAHLADVRRHRAARRARQHRRGRHHSGQRSAREKVLLSVVNIQEERTLKNVPAYVRDDAALRVRYENPPTFLNLAVLVAATHANYGDALLALRGRSCSSSSATSSPRTTSTRVAHRGAPLNDVDRLVEFKLIFNLWSPTLEEVNDMWGMLGGKQFPFALYSMRMLELRFQADRARERPDHRGRQRLPPQGRR